MFSTITKYNVKRQQIFAAVSYELAYQVDNHSLYQIPHTAFNQQNEIMLFVANLGCTQNLATYHNKQSPQQKINILNTKFSLKVIENRIANSWVYSHQ
ncbi:MAG: hypothetical protein ACL7BU_05680 [Candidatus Phlomobacter fragariae]